MEKLLDKGFDSQIEQIPGLFWKPWIGSDFKKLDNRLLIVGESHYISAQDEEEYTRKYDECKNSSSLTRDCIYESAILQDWCNNTYENTHRALLRTNSFNREELWKNLAFYNFIPRTMDYRKRERPNYVDFYNSWQTFIHLLEIINPTAILFIGVEASNSFNMAMEALNISFNGARWETRIGNTYSRTASLSHNENDIPLVFIQHASQFFSWSKWSEFIENKLPKHFHFLQKVAGVSSFIESEEAESVSNLKAFEIPTLLTHKPIISSYYPVYSGETDDDAIFLSAGRAQYDHLSMSIKLFRMNGSKWSRQSEEIPIERAPDFTLMLLAAINISKNLNQGKTLLNEQVISEEDLTFISAAVDNNKERIKKSLEEIKRLINKIDLDNF
jgi:hypothetical protein